jgi:hypothetical protein
MSQKTSKRKGTAACALLMLGVVLLGPLGVSAATTPIYKCFDKSLGLLYTDEPCKEGEVLDIRAGDADPAAVARLERAREALDRNATQRIADERRASVQRDVAASYGIDDAARVYDSPEAYSPYEYGVIGWLPASARNHPPRSRPPKMPGSRRPAPKPPHTASRH